MSKNTSSENNISKIPVWSDEEYFKLRLENQLEFYDKAAKNNKSKYQYFKRIEFILAASIPVLIGLSAYFDGASIFSIKSSTFSIATILQIIAALAGIVLAFTNKIIELDEYYKNWKDYRLTHELLQKQKILYMTKCEPYTSDNAFKILIKNVETILSTEVKNWSIQKTDDKDDAEKALSSIDQMFKLMSEKNSTTETVQTTSSDNVDKETTENLADNIEKSVIEEIVEEEKTEKVESTEIEKNKTTEDKTVV